MVELPAELQLGDRGRPWELLAALGSAALSWAIKPGRAAAARGVG